MKSLAWHAALLALSAWISWWLFLRIPPSPAIPGAREPAAVLKVLPLVREAVAPPSPLVERASEPPPPVARQEPEREPAPLTGDPPAPAEAGETAAAEEPAGPPPREAGTPEGSKADGSPDETDPSTALEPGEAAPVAAAAAAVPAPPEPAAPPEEEAPGPGSALDLPEPPRQAVPRDGSSSSAPEPEPAAEERTAGLQTSRGAVEALMRDPALVASAREEFAQRDRKGFATVLLAAPEEQIEIARFFGEELVLVPRAALDPSSADRSYFRLAQTGPPVVERIDGAPPLEDHRQYRDLFDYEYARLPAALRELRRSLVARGEVYLFAALLSPQEWALVIARRRAALERAGRELAEVRRFVLRYARLPAGGFDLEVEEIVFADGSRFDPGLAGKGDG